LKTAFPAKNLQEIVLQTCVFIFKGGQYSIDALEPRRFQLFLFAWPMKNILTGIMQKDFQHSPWKVILPRIGTIPKSTGSFPKRRGMSPDGEVNSFRFPVPTVFSPFQAVEALFPVLWINSGFGILKLITF
jgi:hypothetical protein